MRMVECPKCRQSMAEGFLLDRGHDGIPYQAQWVEGAPKFLFWRFLKLGRTRRRPVSAYRCSTCSTCGYLELYAAAGPNP
jgi:hypothetical protein